MNFLSLPFVVVEPYKMDTLEMVHYNENFLDTLNFQKFWSWESFFLFMFFVDASFVEVKHYYNIIVVASFLHNVVVDLFHKTFVDSFHNFEDI